MQAVYSFYSCHLTQELTQGMAHRYRLAFDSNDESSPAVWTYGQMNYGPMETTYQHDYQKPKFVGVVVKSSSPPPTAFWDESVVYYRPMETTYQHDYKDPIKMKMMMAVTFPTYSAVPANNLMKTRDVATQTDNLLHAMMSSRQGRVPFIYSMKINKNSS